MVEPIDSRLSRAPPSRGVTRTDVERAADALLRGGQRPTIEKIRAALGGGSPNTVNPLLDEWWRRLSARLDSGPAALHRLPESVAHVAEALWMQALDEGRRRAQSELQSSVRSVNEQNQSLGVRSHVLTLREGELDSRLRDREITITNLNMQLRELTLILRKEQATREAQARRIAALEGQRFAKAKTRPRRPRTPPLPTVKPGRSGAKTRKKAAAGSDRKHQATARRRG